MQIQQIEYLIEVAKTGSITAAAENLHVTSATISQAITKLERDLGFNLFTGSRLGSKPTQEGNKIIEKALLIKGLINEIENESNTYNKIGDKELKIVASPSTLVTILPKAIKIFSEKHPNTEITLEENQEVIERMLTNEFDVGFLSSGEVHWVESKNVKLNAFHFDTLSHGRMYVCVHPNSSLAFKESVTPEDLTNHTFIVHSITRPWYDDLKKKYGPIKILFETVNTEIIKKAISEQNGISLLSDFNIKDDMRVKNGEIIPIPITSYEHSNVLLGYLRSKNRYYSNSTREFIKIVKENNALIKE